MKVSSFKRFTINLIGLVLLGAGSPILHATSEMKIQLVRDALIIIPVTANDEGPFYFLLDTGADTTIIDSTLAKELSLVPVASAREVTVIGSQTVNVNRLARLAIGTVHVEGLPVLEEDLSRLRQMDGRIRGIIGQDVLSRFNYLLDYRARSLQIEEDDDIREAINGEPVVVQREHNRMIVTAEAQSLGHARLRLLLDSGANALVLMGPASNALRCPIVRQGIETSIAGAALLRTGRVDLKVASSAFHDLPVSLGTEAASQNIGDGLLPTVLFERLYVSNSEQFVILNPRAKKTSKASGNDR